MFEVRWFLLIHESLSGICLITKNLNFLFIASARRSMREGTCDIFNNTDYDKYLDLTTLHP